MYPEGVVDFSFTEEQLMLQDVARRIAQRKIAQRGASRPHRRVPLDNIRLLARTA